MKAFIQKIIIAFLAVAITAGTLFAVSCGEKPTAESTPESISTSAESMPESQPESESEPETPFVPQTLSEDLVNTFDEEYVNLYGRTYIRNEALVLDHAATAIEFGIYGQWVKAYIDSGNALYICVYVDDSSECKRISLNGGSRKYMLFEDLDDGYHKIRIVKSSEAIDGTISIIQLYADEFATVPEKSGLKIEFIGDSITAGYGILAANGNQRSTQNSDAASAYAYTCASALDADYSIVAVSGICVAAHMWQTIEMRNVYKQISTNNTKPYGFGSDPDVVVINIGTNEATYLVERSSDYASDFPDDYFNFLADVRERNPHALIICIYGMMGEDTRITRGIETAIDVAGDERIIMFRDFEPNNDAVAGHPDKESQQTWGNALAEFIKENLK